MTVRNIGKTTVSLLVLITGFVFFRLYYIDLVAKLLKLIIKIDCFPLVSTRLFPIEYIGAYYPRLFYICVIAILVVRLIDVILDEKVAFKMLSSFVAPLILMAIITIALCIVKLNILQLWAIIYLCLIICLHQTVRIIMKKSSTVGKYANLKLFKDFFPKIIDTIKNVFSKYREKFNNPVDEFFVLLSSFIVLLLELMVVVSYIVYFTKYWRIIFLSHLINIF